jgi:hypothetical protein
MLLYLFFLLVVISVFVSLADWRKGLFLMILIAAIQDPVRKLTPGAPAYLSILTVPVWSAILFSLFTRTGSLWYDFKQSYRNLSAPIVFFIISLLPAALISATYGMGSWKLTFLGLFLYIGMICAWLVGYAYDTGQNNLRKLLSFYCIVNSVMLIGTPLQSLGFFEEWAALGTQSLSFIWVRSVTDYTVKMISGFYRSPDVMGWHAAMTTMIAVVLSLGSRDNKRFFWLFIAAWGLSAAILCGRRKMVMMIPIFIATLLWIYWKVRYKSRAVRVFGILLVVFLVGFTIYEQIGRNQEIERYYLSELSDIPIRMHRHNYDDIVATYDQAGFFGAGLGTASQGSQYLSIERPRTWQEGGISKILVEMGVPGLICFGVLIVSLVRNIMNVIVKITRDRKEFTLMSGLFGILVANASSFIVSHQIFGDPFILIFFSVMIGFLLSFGRLYPENKA